ncbi:hypothetical protein LY76DRAFT_404855 [Colletotrichum caudatum]|nr:hypothetical protein LY76DRAFT_404855 [Colletotrichum caudatum]
MEPLNMRQGPEERVHRSRVCDNCIRQKVRCDFGKPGCSRCIERGLPCTYSLVRRKPGPTPGSRRRGGPHINRAAPDPVDNRALPAVEVLPSRLSSSVETIGPTCTDDSHASLIESPSITPQEEDSLLAWYFGNLHKAIPLFVVDSPSSGLEPAKTVAGCSRDLIETIAVISAKLSRNELSAVTEDVLNAQIDKMLGAASLHEDINDNCTDLDHFRQSCILVFYEYHQCPGKQAWMRLGKLVRSAYWVGLDRIDKMYETFPQWRAMTEVQLEEWRLVWWCIYCLDSYANLSSGMPYGIDERLINTVLPGGKSGENHQSKALPSEPDGLVQLMRTTVAQSPPDAGAIEIQIISMTILRHVGRAIQLHVVAKLDELGMFIRNTEQQLSALRLVLPSNFFNPSRNAFVSETTVSHHFRLVTVHHILMAQMLISIGHCRLLDEGEEWLCCWQRVLELCQDVAAIESQWKREFCSRVDPALCIIGFVSLIFLDLQLKWAAALEADATILALKSNIQHCQTIILLFLENFAEIWTLPRLLILSFKAFKEALPSSIGCSQVQALLRCFESPLHPRWLTFLQSELNLEGCS